MYRVIIMCMSREPRLADAIFFDLSAAMNNAAARGGYLVRVTVIYSALAHYVGRVCLNK